MGIGSKRNWGLWLLAFLSSGLIGCATLERSRGAIELAKSNPSLVTCDCKIGSITAGKLVADEPTRLWLADERGVHELQADGQLRRVWSTPRFARLLRLEAADLDGDGISEWVVLYDTGRFRSHVLSWNGETWEASKPWAGFLRPVENEAGGIDLLGQAPGGRKYHAETVSIVSREEDGKLRPGERVETLTGLPLYDFFWTGSPRERLFVLEANGSITERDPRSPKAVLWRLDERIVARPIEMERQSRDMLGQSEDERIRLAPVPVVGINAAGTEEVLVVSGPPVPVFAFENMRISGGGDVRLFSVGSRGLDERVRSPLLGLDLSASWAGEALGRTLWIAAVWTKDGGGFSKPESRVFRLDPATGDPIKWEDEAP
jgi:hypothetical protein